MATTPKFTRRDFQWLADFMRETHNRRCTAGWEIDEALAAMTVELADRLTATNPNFNRDRFMRAATPEGKAVPE